MWLNINPNERINSMEYIHNLIWLCPLLFAAGFIDSIAGGGGLIAMPAYMMCGMPIHLVYGCNKFHYLSDSQIRTMLMFLLPMTALLVIFVKNAWNYTARTQPLTARSVLMALITGMVIGLYDSLYGPGGGTIALLLFTFLLRYDVRTSSGNAKMALILKLILGS